MTRDEQLKNEIYKRIRIIEFYRNSIYNGLRRKKIFNIISFSILLCIIILNIVGILRFEIINNISIQLIIIIYCLIPISMAIWFFSRKSEEPDLRKYNNMSVDELEIELSNLKQLEIESYDMGARIIANNFFLLFAFIFVFIYIVVQTFYTDSPDYHLANKDSIEITAVLIVFLMLIVYQIGSLIGSPITPRKYQKDKLTFLNTVKYSFYDNLTNSSLNPDLCKK